MSYFIYKAKKGPKEVLEGRIEADSEKAAVTKLMGTGCYPIWIKEETLAHGKELDRKSFFLKRIKSKDIALFTRQLSDLLDSGLELYESLNILENQLSLPQLKEVVSNIRYRIKDGKTFSESLESYPQIFSKLYINLVRSGEAGGMLKEVLANISDFLEKQEDIRSKVSSSLVYPILMAAVGIVTIFILMVFVIPKLANMFVEMGEILPLPTRILIGVSDFVRTYWILLFVFIGGIVLFIKRSKSNKLTKRAADRLKLKFPILGTLIRDSDLSRFTRTLSTLLKNGVPMLDSLKITSDIIDNEVIKEEVVRIYSDVRAGSSLQAAIKKNTSFPLFIVNMAAIGEEGGILDKTLLKVAKSLESEIDRAVKIVSSLLEPAMIIIMGLIVSFIVVSMLLPVFQISLTAH